MADFDEKDVEEFVANLFRAKSLTGEDRPANWKELLPGAISALRGSINRLLKRVSVNIVKYGVDTDPPTEVYSVCVENGEGSWHETMSTREHLEILLTGIKIGLDMAGYYGADIPLVIPEEASARLTLSEAGAASV